jgi:cystathionine gamma-synthase
MLHIFTKGRGGGATTVHRRLASSLTPEEAGRRAEEKVKSALKNQESLSSSSALSSIAAHAGIEHGPNAPMAPPLHLATTYTRPADGLYLESDSTYSRHDNPTRLQLEKTMASLETHQLRLDKKTTLDEEVICCAFSSGMMAVSSIFLAHSSPVTVILPEDLYHGVPTLIHEVFQRHNISICQIDMRKSENISKTLSSLDTTMDVIVWVETPSNPKCHVLDIQEICSLVRSTTINATIVVDSTMAPPVITQPLLVS